MHRRATEKKAEIFILRPREGLRFETKNKENVEQSYQITLLDSVFLPLLNQRMRSDN